MKRKFLLALGLISSLTLSSIYPISNAAIQAKANKTPDIALSSTKITLKVNAKKSLKVKKGKQIKIVKVTFKSKKPVIASVTKKGQITAKKQGNTSIVASVTYKKKAKKVHKTLTCRVFVTTPNTSVDEVIPIPTDPTSVATPAPSHNHVHTYGTWEVVKDSTCKAIGEKHRFCTSCNEEQKLTIPVKEHQWKVTKQTEADCEADGITVKTCSACKDTKEEVVPAYGHEPYVVDTDIKPTCTEEGSTADVLCRACRKVIKAGETIPALGHKYKHQVVDVTCGEDGYTQHTCERCGDGYRDSIVKAEEHSWTDGLTLQEPTCTAPGIKRSTCKKCGDTQDIEIPALGHTNTVVDEQPATCMKDGYHKVICTICNQEVENTPIFAIGHQVSDTLTTDKEVTCTEDGIQSYHCMNCDYTEREIIIPALGHNFSDSVNGAMVSTASCTQPAKFYDACTRCYISDKTSTHFAGSMIPHKYIGTGWITDVHQAQKCAFCDHLDTSIIYCSVSQFGCDPFAYKLPTNSTQSLTPSLMLPKTYTNVNNNDCNVHISDYQYCDISLTIDVNTTVSVGVNTDGSSSYKHLTTVTPNNSDITITVPVSELINKPLYFGLQNITAAGRCAEFTLSSMTFYK